MKHSGRFLSLRLAAFSRLATPFRLATPSRLATAAALAASVFVGAVGSAGADEYSVQIGAFVNPDPSFATAAEKIGKIHETRNPNGLTRIQVGRYGSEAEASVALSALAGAGYSDAYIVNKTARLDDAARKGQRSMRAGATASNAVSTRGSRGDDASLLASVPAELRARTVLLDGRLHVMEGDRFIPLRQYLAGSR